MDVDVTAANIYAADMLEVVFDQPVRNNEVLKSLDTYTVQAVSDGQAVTIKEVRPGTDVGVTSVFLIITAMTIGEAYTVSVVGAVVSLDQDPMSANNNFRVIARRTKIDSLCSTRPPLYDLRPKARYRNILNAIGREDDRIGGSQDEGEEIIR